MKQNAQAKRDQLRTAGQDNLYCYLRVSTQGQVEQGHSIDNQRATGKRIAKQLGLTYKEMNEGGLSSMALVRPVLEKVLKGIATGEIQNIWYFSRSRWTREMISDLVIKRDYLVKYGVNVYEGESGSQRKLLDPNDEFFDNIITGYQQHERRNIRMRSVSGKRHLSLSKGETGVFMGGTIAFGYSNIDKKWTINKEEASIVKQMFSLYAQGTSIQDIKGNLDSQGIKPRRSKLWNIHTILKMLKNTTYVGDHSWFDKENKKHYPINVPAIITHSLFNRVQIEIEKNVRHKGNNLRKYESLLSNFLKCSCGEKILGHARKTVNKKVYVCSSKNYKWKGKEVRDCSNRRGMDMDKTDKFVLGCIKDIMGNSSILKDRFKTDVLAQKDVDSSQIEIEKDMREKHIKSMNYAIEKIIQNLATNKVNNMMGRTEQSVYEKIEKILGEEKSIIEDKKAALIEEIKDLDARKDWIDWITRFGDDINKQFDTPSVELLDGMVSSILVEATFDKNRDGIEKQVGHKLKVRFKQPIVDDSIEYKNPNKHSDGYNVKSGKKIKNVGSLEISKGGRGHKKKAGVGL